VGKMGATARIATIDINDACPLRCSFCYNTAKLAMGRRMPFHKFNCIIESLPLLLRVNIGGGDPMLNPFLPDMLNLLFQKNIHADVSVSGLIWNEEAMQTARLGGSGFSLQINLPAGNESSFFTVSGKNLLQNAIANIEKFVYFLGENAVRLRITLCKENLDSILAASELAKKFGIPLNIDLMLSAFGITATKLEPNEIEAALLQTAALRAAGYAVFFHHPAKTECPALAKTYGVRLIEGKCPALNEERIYIDPDGNQKGCEFLD